jgi:recombination DNA repair RAD52 pathway protein
MKDIEKELQKPLDATKVKTRQQAGTTLSYIEAWHVIAEANRIFGHLAWNRETILIEHVSKTETEKTGVDYKTKQEYKYTQYEIGYIAKVRITVGDVVREGTGAGSGISKSLADAHEGAAKEAESDAMKRAFMTFGHPFGLALYDKEKNNVQAPIPDKIMNGYKKILLDIPAIHDLVQIDETFKGQQYVYLEKNYPELASEIMAALQVKQNQLNGVK